MAITNYTKDVFCDLHREVVEDEEARSFVFLAYLEASKAKAHFSWCLAEEEDPEEEEELFKCYKEADRWFNILWPRLSNVEQDWMETYGHAPWQVH